MNPNDFMMDTNLDSDEGDKKLIAIFYKSFEVNEAKSAEAGHPVHDDIDLIKIMSPGSRDTVVAKADWGYQTRFPRQWAQYKANAAQTSSGLQVTEVPWLTPAQVADLKASNVHTLEQLVAMPDAQAHTMMGFHGLKQRAQTYLDAAAGAAPALKLQAELEKRDAEIEELKTIVGRLVAEKKTTKKAGATDLA